MVVDRYFCRIETQLYDVTGKLLEPHDSRGGQGMQMPPDRIQVSTVKPGDAVEVMTFSIVTDYAHAMAGSLSWEVQDLAGQTLKVGFTCSFPKENLARVEKMGAVGAVAGDWTSPKVEVPTAKLKQHQVNIILASRKPILDPGAIPLLMKALDGNQAEETREFVAESLGALKATVAAPVLAQRLLKDQARGVRVHAARALGEIASPETREALTKAAREDEDSLVRTLSEDALKKLPH